ncbi:esterase [Amylibacter ulvae]|uniref:Esterase n=1 Tax=Paramylibacter ulvae TaxID=1651968 RepID=A0ABQ3D6M5_9RHOB|nr:alpha/beta fold hydrolase [Amylibacter ulvae]GHA58779.1 esterase [Amylibacter ulvae]
MDIVLVHGAWHGGWCWQRVAPQLRAAGHRVITPTLTGLGARQHLASDNINVDTHVTDIIQEIHYAEMDNIMLVGHSYGGFVITGVADQLGDQIASMIYLDAFVPTKNGQSPIELGSKVRTQDVTAATHENFTIAPTAFAKWSKDANDIAWLKKMTTPHPIRCFADGITLSENPTTARKMYLLCKQNTPSAFHGFYEIYNGQDGWDTDVFDCLHDAMVERPELVIQKILEFAN